MCSRAHHTFAKFLIVGITVFCAATPAGFAQDQAAPPWGEFLRRFNKDPLLKKPFHMSPETEVKGLSSKIRARELDVPNRKRAIQYLKDLDCTQFPEAKEMLVSLLDPNKEKWEDVRFEAAKGLRDMLARHSCNPDSQANSKGENSKYHSGSCPSRQADACGDSLWQQCCNSSASVGKRVRGERTKAQEPACHCTSCCDAETLNKLAKTAYEMNEKGCCYEPSLRVREMAVEAIKACGVPCHYKPYYGEFNAEPGPSPLDEATQKTGPGRGQDQPSKSNDGGDQPPQAEEAPDTARSPVPAVTNVVTPITRLTNLCIVSWANGQRIKPNPQISATHRGRMYYFSSESAKRTFVENPERYAVSFGGCDPVHFVLTQQAVEGRFLAAHEGRFFMFATQENFDIFKANSDRYTPKVMQSDRVALNQ